MNHLKSTVDIKGLKAKVNFDLEIGLFRGEFLDLTGGADFYAADLDGLIAEGEISRSVYLAMCAEKRVEPYK